MLMILLSFPFLCVKGDGKFTSYGAQEIDAYLSCGSEYNGCIAPRGYTYTVVDGYRIKSDGSGMEYDRIVGVWSEYQSDITKGSIVQDWESVLKGYITGGFYKTIINNMGIEEDIFIKEEYAIIVETYITNAPNSYGRVESTGATANAKYSIKLTPDDIQIIRQYNDKTTYDYYTLECDSKGNNCTSKFLEGLGNGILRLYDEENGVELTWPVRNRLATRS